VLRKRLKGDAGEEEDMEKKKKIYAGGLKMQKNASMRNYIQSIPLGVELEKSRFRTECSQTQSRWEKERGNGVATWKSKESFSRCSRRLL